MCRPLIGLLAVTALAAQDAPEVEGATASTAIRSSAYLNSEVMASLTHLTDRVGPRLTGTTGHRAAAEWAYERLAALGLSAQLDEFELPHAWRRGPAEARVVVPMVRELAIATSGWSPPTDGVVRASLSTALDGDGVVLVDPITAPLVPSPSHPCPSAAVVLVDAQRPYGLVPTGLATWAAPFVPGARPSAFVAADDAALLRRLATAGPVELEVSIESAFDSEVVTADVLADLPGGVAEHEIVLAVAHLDSWDLGPGAIDDAAGCAVLLEAARILAALPKPPKRTIRFALLAGVEQGVGTEGYASRRSAEELAHHVGGFAIEGGGGRLLGVMLAGQEGFLTRAEAWFAPVKDLGVTDIGFRASARRLPQALQDRGVPVFAMVQEAPELALVTGSRADTPEKLLPQDLMQAACVLAQGLWAWANE